MGLNVLLINPDLAPDFPLGRLPAGIPVALAVLAGVLLKEGHKVFIADDYLEQKGPAWVAQKALEVNAAAVGISVNLSTVSSAAKIITILRPLNIPVVVGGPEVTVNPERTLRASGAPYGIRGEGEITLVEWLRAFRDGAAGQEIAKIPGLCYLNKNGDFISNITRDWLPSLDDLPFMALEMFPLSKYYRAYSEFSQTPVDYFNTSRGCPFNCSFCSNRIIWSKKYRFMSAKRVADEVEHMLTHFGSRGIYFREDHFTLDRQRVLDFCEEIRRRGLSFEWGCESRVDALDDYLVKEMAAHGCSSIYFGVEAGTQRVLDFLNKGIKIDQIRAAFRLCKKYHIKTGASVMFGLPGQTREESKETLKFVWELDPDWTYFSAYLGLPGSDMYEYIREKGLIYRQWESLILPNSEFMTWPQKLKYKQRAEILFNLRPKVMFRHLKRMGVRRLTEKVINNLKRTIRSLKMGQ